jgi:hypothetical protein
MRQKTVAQFGVTVCRKSLKNEPLGKIDMKILKVAVALGLATSLSGCLSDDNTDVDVVSMARTLLTEVNAEGVKTFQLSQIDPSSTATMTGVIGARFAGSAPADGSTGMGFGGQLSMVADFGEAKVSGSTSNLGVYEYSSGCLTGGECETTRLSSLDGDLTLVGDIARKEMPGLAGFNDNLQGLVSGDVTLGEDDYAFSAAVDLDTNDGETGGFFLQDEDVRLFAQSGLNGTANAVYEDENGNADTFSQGLEGYMIVEGDVVADVPE